MSRVKASVRERVSQGKSVRPRALADAMDVSPATVYAWISDGKLEAIAFEGIISIPSHAARPLLGMPEIMQAAA